jgi:alpha-ribazole phosphatase
VHLTLIRHTTVVAPGVCYGRHNPPLAETFEQEAAAIKARIAALSGVPFYCSPAQRCRLLAEYLQVRHEHEDRLQELNFGDWDGRHWDDIPREQSEAWFADFVNHVPPNGESYAQLSQRALELMRELANRHKEVGVITHSGVIHAVLAHVHGIPLHESYQKLKKVGYGEVLQVEFKP